MNHEEYAYQPIQDISAFPANSSVEWGWLNLDDTYRQNVVQTIVAHDHTALQQNDNDEYSVALPNNPEVQDTLRQMTEHASQASQILDESAFQSGIQFNGYVAYNPANSLLEAVNIGYENARVERDALYFDAVLRRPGSSQRITTTRSLAMSQEIPRSISQTITNLAPQLNRTGSITLNDALNTSAERLFDSNMILDDPPETAFKAVETPTASPEAVSTPEIESYLPQIPQITPVSIAQTQQLAATFANFQQEAFVCVSCNTAFSSAKMLSDHALTHNVFKCVRKGCREKFPSPAAMSQHVYSHLKPGSPVYVCQYCDVPWDNAPNCKRHERTHTGEKPFVCKVCGMRFSQNNNLKTHLKNMHN